LLGLVEIIARYLANFHAIGRLFFIHDYFEKQKKIPLNKKLPLFASLTALSI